LCSCATIKVKSKPEVNNEAYNQCLAIFNKYFKGFKKGDYIISYQTDESDIGIVYHIRLKLKNGIYMLVRTTTDIEDFKCLFDILDYKDNKKLSVNIIIAESVDTLDWGRTRKGDWNSSAGHLLILNSKECYQIASR
ncbi:MAG: hypothetical protein ABSG25_01630, partial [Bryobacteraceae bacterium]